MKTIHVLGSRQYGGADRFYVRLVEALNAAGHEALAVNRPGSPVARALAQRGLRQVALPFANKWDVTTTLRLARLVTRERPVAVQTYMGRATRLTRIPRRSAAVHVARLGGYYKIRGYYEHCDAWVGNTRGVCDYLVREGLPADRVFHVGNFVPEARAVDADELATLRVELSMPADALVLFTLGRFIDIKGFDDLLEAFALLPRAYAGRPLHLVIVGDGPLAASLRAVCERLDLTGRVHWPGWRDDPEPFFGLADVFVCPSRHETLGNVILEAWNHGLPVVSTTTPGALEIVTDGEDGLLCPVGDPRQLAARLRTMLELSARDRAALASAGGRTLRAAHGQEAVVADYLSLYDQLTRIGRRQRR